MKGGNDKPNRRWCGVEKGWFKESKTILHSTFSFYKRGRWGEGGGERDRDREREREMEREGGVGVHNVE